jgi:hypothetical protein
VSQSHFLISPDGSSDPLWRGALEPHIRMTMPVNDTDHADGTRVQLEVHSVRKALQQHPTQATVHNREVLGIALDL